MDKIEQDLREAIFAQVRAIFKHRSQEVKFIPGVTPVRYAGRVLIINLVDSSLDFWLTAPIRR